MKYSGASTPARLRSLARGLFGQEREAGKPYLTPDLGESTPAEVTFRFVTEFSIHLIPNKIPNSNTFGIPSVIITVRMDDDLHENNPEPILENNSQKVSEKSSQIIPENSQPILEQRLSSLDTHTEGARAEGIIGASASGGSTSEMEIDFNSFRYKGVKPISKKQTIKISPSLELQTEKNEYPSNFVIENLDKKMTHLSIQNSVPSGNSGANTPARLRSLARG